MSHSPKVNKLIEDCIENSNRWNLQFLEVNVRSLELYENQKEFDQLVQQFLSKKSRLDFNAVNPYSNQIWIPALLQAFAATLETWSPEGIDDPDEPLPIVCAMVTFTHEGWICADHNIEFELKSAKQKVRNALNGVDYVARFEPALYTNRTWWDEQGPGKLVAFHCHAICWASSYSVLKRLRRRVMGRFVPPLGNKAGVRLDRLDTPRDLIRTVTYIGKMPVLGKRLICSGNKTVQRSSRMTYTSRYQIFNALKKYDLFTFWLSSGGGKSILREARAKLNGRSISKTEYIATNRRFRRKYNPD